MPEAEWPRAIAELTSFPHIEEAAVLSTCNRMELYIVALSQRRGTREVPCRPHITVPRPGHSGFQTACKWAHCRFEELLHASGLRCNSM